MRSGRIVLAVLAALAPSAARATDWYTGAQDAQRPSPTSFISFFDPNPPPIYGISPVATPAVTPVRKDA